MTGFDPRKFVEREVAKPRAEEDAVDFGFDPPPRATVSEKETVQPPVDSWETPPPRVAGVATVAALRADLPFAAVLNGMFDQEPPKWLRATLWARLLNDARKFVDGGKCALAVELGWQPIELFGFDAIPWRRAFWGRQVWGTLGLISLLRGRGVGEVEAHRIEIINRIGAHERLNRATAVMNRRGSALMWEAFEPGNQPPPNAVLLGSGEIVDIRKRPFGLPP